MYMLPVSYTHLDVDDKRLAVADVQIAVRLGREARVHLFALKPAAGGDVLGDELLYKVVVAGCFVHSFHPLLAFKLPKYYNTLHSGLQRQIRVI